MGAQGRRDRRISARTLRTVCRECALISAGSRGLALRVSRRGLCAKSRKSRPWAAPRRRVGPRVVEFDEQPVEPQDRVYFVAVGGAQGVKAGELRELRWACRTRLLERSRPSPPGLCAVVSPGERGPLLRWSRPAEAGPMGSAGQRRLASSRRAQSQLRVAAGSWWSVAAPAGRLRRQRHRYRQHDRRQNHQHPSSTYSTVPGPLQTSAGRRRVYPLSCVHPEPPSLSLRTRHLCACVLDPPSCLRRAGPHDLREALREPSPISGFD